MTLVEKVRAVEAVFINLDAEIATFQNWSGLHCQYGCGKCCFKADIEASVLEFLPFALHLYEQGLACQWLENLKNSSSPICAILNPTQNQAGLCSEYAYRGLICRLFGYSARTNKYGRRELVTCQIIKTGQKLAYDATVIKIENDEKLPVMNQYYMQMQGIDHQLAQDFYPINDAIKRAIETVLHYYAYRN